MYQSFIKQTLSKQAPNMHHIFAVNDWDDTEPDTDPISVSLINIFGINSINILTK